MVRVVIFSNDLALFFIYFFSISLSLNVNFFNYRYLEYALDPSKIGPSYLSYVMHYITDTNELGANVAWNFFQLKWEKISKV